MLLSYSFVTHPGMLRLASVLVVTLTAEELKGVLPGGRILDRD
jgi:hypothetical protein